MLGRCGSVGRVPGGLSPPPPRTASTGRGSTSLAPQHSGGRGRRLRVLLGYSASWRSGRVLKHLSMVGIEEENLKGGGVLYDTGHVLSLVGVS